MISGSRRDAGLPALLLAVAATAGGAIGVVAVPGAAWTVLAATLAQLAASVPVRWPARRPVVFAGLTALVTLGVALEPTMRDLLRQGGIPWVTLAQAVGTYDLVRRARTGSERGAGVALLMLAVAGVVVTTVQGGAPVVPSVLASSVPVLGGALVATVEQLGEARRDRLSRGVPPPGPAGGGDRDVARRALLLVALRAEILLTAARDDDAAAQARDLRTVALQGLNLPDAASGATLTVQVDGGRTGAAAPDEAPAAAPVEVPPLSEREREIVRLLVTGASNAQIARELYLSEATVKGHVSRLMRRFGRDNRTQLALLAARWFG